jgi:hypothetical protein
MITDFIRQKLRSVQDDLRRARVYKPLYAKYRQYTMITLGNYVNNLAVVDGFRSVPGCVIECGTWRGGMIAGMAELLGPDRQYYLFDSFEGLPPAKPVDGPAALAWQANTGGANYYDNCTASLETAQDAMARSGAKRVAYMRGWFQDTLKIFQPDSRIAVLRLDGDWFESTLTCLESLYPHMSEDGVILLDDYYTWDGCSRAVHYFLAKHGYAAQVRQIHGICAIRPNFSSEVLPAWGQAANGAST